MTYDPRALDLAYNAVRTEHISASRAALTYDVPVSTLKDRLNGRVQLNCVPGQSPLFSQSEEAQLVDHAKYMSSIGYGYSRMDMRHVATDLAVCLGKRDNTSILTDHWVTNLLKRWPTLKLNKARSLEHVRAKVS